MKIIITNFLLIGLFFFGLLLAADGQTKTIEPTAKEAIKQIFLNADIRLADAQFCKGMGSNAADKTILDFLSGVLSFQAEPKTNNNVEFSFKQEKNERGELVWVCDVMFKGSDDADIWNNGIRFNMRNSDRKLIRRSLICIGSG